MTKKTGIARMATGVRNLDEILGGGWPLGSVTVIAGPPGSGKTVLAHQICFHNASLTQHDRDTHLFEIGKGGLRIGHVLGKPAAQGSKEHIL